jgi:lipoate-protein ligase A
MAPRFRVIDTGVRDARPNIAFDQALIGAHRAGAIPDTIRFLQFRPSALVGRHQDLSQEIRLDYCQENGIGVGRRITGGGALYLDEGQIGWELVFRRDTLGIGELGGLTKAICEAAAAGLSRLGVDARFRPRSDIEVDGQKLCGTGGFFDGDTLFYQGTLLIDFDPARMIAALKLPAPPPEADTAPPPRMTTLRALLGDRTPALDAIHEAMLKGFRSGLGVEAEWGQVSDAEEERARAIHDQEIGTDAFVHEIDDADAAEDVRSASERTPGGTVTAHLRLEGPHRNRLREVLVTGDFFVTPPRAIYDLEASLRGLTVDQLGDAVSRYFADARVGILTVSPDVFRRVIESAAA